MELTIPPIIPNTIKIITREEIMMPTTVARTYLKNDFIYFEFVVTAFVTVRCLNLSGVTKIFKNQIKI